MSSPETTATPTTTAGAPGPQAREITLDDIIKEGRLARDPAEQDRARDLIGELVGQVMDGTMTMSRDTQTMINARIGAIDQLISEQLNEILHHEDFQKLEGSWRGLNYFVSKSTTSKDLQIKVLNVSKRDLLRDMERAPQFDQSALFKKVYEEEFGTFGGAPFGALVGDYEFGRTAQDVTLLEKISEVASAAHAPFVAAANPQLFNWDDFTEMAGPRDLAKIFDATDYVKWRSFRDSEESRYVGLCLPHILMRLPYGPESPAEASFIYREDVDGTDHKKYLWGNAAYAMATRLTEAFESYGWCAAIRGVEGGGKVAGLPAHTFKTDRGDVALKCPTEIAITDRRENELSNLGFIPLVHCKNTDYAAFFAAQSCQKPKLYDADAANANASLSTQLPYILAVSRFAHYLKAMMRDKIGSFVSRADCESDLNRWISRYVTTDDSAGQEAKSQYPLRDARIEVVDVAGKPGAYKAVAFLKPHFQLNELTVSLRLVADLPTSAR